VRHSRLTELLDILIGDPQQFLYAATVHADSLEASLERVDFDRDSEEYVVRVFKPLAERTIPKCEISLRGRS